MIRFYGRAVSATPCIANMGRGWGCLQIGIVNLLENTLEIIEKKNNFQFKKNSLEQ